MPIVKLNSPVPVRVGYGNTEKLEQLKMKKEAFATKVEDFVAKSSDWVKRVKNTREERSELNKIETKLIQAEKELNEAIDAVAAINENDCTTIMKEAKENAEPLKNAAKEFNSKAGDFIKNLSKPAMDKLEELKEKKEEVYKAIAADITELFTMTEELCVQIAALCHDLGKPVSSSFILKIY